MTSNTLIQQFTDGDNTFPIIGHICWWNVHNVDIIRDQLVNVLKSCNIDEKFARSHNFRATFIRSLRELESNRIIRLVEETPSAMFYQFTSETRVEGDEHELQYDREDLITIDKVHYRKTQNIAESITAEHEDIRQRLINLFADKMDRYHSSDITRLIQRVFTEKADIISLREQGGVYFVPSTFYNVLQAVSQFVNSVGNSKFQHFPLPDVDACRQAVANAVDTEMRIDLEKMEKEIEAVKNGEKEVTDKWRNHRIEMIAKVNTRINRYREVLTDQAAQSFSDNFENLKSSIISSRSLDI
jgi:hypothetical protein